MLTKREIEIEKAYRRIERIGILIGGLATVTPQQTMSAEKIARDEADEWEKTYREENKT